MDKGFSHGFLLIWGLIHGCLTNQKKTMGKTLVHYYF